MAASMKNEIFDSVKTLLQLLNDIERKKIIAQKTCEGYHDLFKPWSLDRGEGDEEKKEQIEPVQTEEDKLTTAEKTELELVDKLLSKAEKAYKIKEQLSAPKRPPFKEGTRSSSKTSKSGHDNGSEPTTNTESDKNENAKIKDITRCDKTVISEVKGKQNITKPKNPTNSVKPVTTDTEKNKNMAKYGGRARIENRKVQNSSLPHMKAPFQTNPCIPFPKKSTSITKSVPQIRPTSASRYKQVNNRQDMSKNKSQSKGQGQSRIGPSRIEKSRSNVSDTVESLSDHVEEKNASHSNHYDDELKHSGNLDYKSEKCDIRGCIQKGDNGDERKHLEEEDLDKKGSFDVKDRSHRDQMADNMISKNMSDVKLSDEKPPEKEKFNLLTDGHHLTVPVKLRKYAAHSRKLKQKYEMYRVTKKVNGIPAADRFKTAIEMTFTDTEEWTLLKNVTNITNIYNNLKRYFTSLNLEHISETSSVYVLMRTRKALEMILSTFQLTEEQRNQLNTECLDRVDCIGICHVNMITPSQCKPNEWIPTRTKDVWLPHSPSLLQYRSVRQLERFSALLFQIQYLQFQSYVHDLFEEEILPFLKSVHPKSSEFVHLLRSSFSLLTDDATFPVVVRDTIQELEESIVDHDS